MDTLYLVFVVLGFLAVVMLLEGLYLTWNAYRGPEARRIERRLQALSAGTSDAAAAPLLKRRMLSDMPALANVLQRLPRVRVLDRFLMQSGTALTVAGFLGVALALALATTVACALAGLPGALPLVLALVPVGAWIAWVQHKRLQRMRQVDQQLPDALDLMARAMQAGHAFSSALQMVGTEGPQPIAQEFLTAFDEINFGIPFDKAMGNIASRVASADLRFFVVAVLIQRDSGGNLAEILTSISALIRERHKLSGTIRVLSAEGRVSAWILTLLPFALALAISLVNRRFIATLWTDPAGIRMVAVALGLMLLGIWWMWRMVRIRV